MPGERIGKCIMPNSNRVEEYDIAIGETQIVSELIQCNNDESIIDFSNKWGTLSRDYASRREFDAHRDWFTRIYSHKLGLRELGKVVQRHPLGTAEIRFDRCKRGAPLELFWYLKSLSNFVWLEVVQDVGKAGGSLIMTCDSCGEFFSRTTARGPLPKFCSNTCRQVNYRRNRAKN